jgi:hypothetical protein
MKAMPYVDYLFGNETVWKYQSKKWLWFFFLL